MDIKRGTTVKPITLRAGYVIEDPNGNAARVIDMWNVTDYATGTHMFGIQTTRGFYTVPVDADVKLYVEPKRNLDGDNDQRTGK